MALGTDQFTATDLQYHIPEIWSGRMNDFYRANLVCANFFTDLSDAFVGGGDTLNIPSLTEMTANSKSNGSQVTLNSPAETQVSLVVDQWYEVSFLIEDKEAVQVLQSYQLQERYMKNAAYTAAAALEDAIIALFDNFSQTTGASTAGILDSNVRVAIQYLDAANAPQEDRAFFVSPKAMWTDIMAIDKFTLVNQSGTNNPVSKGMTGYLYGIPVYVTSRIGTTLGSAQNCLAHKDAIVHARSLMRTQANYIPEYLGTLVTADILYGVIENRDTSGVWIKTAAA